MEKGEGHISEDVQDGEDGEKGGGSDDSLFAGGGEVGGVESGVEDVEATRREKERKRQREYSAVYRAANPEKVAAYRAANRELIRAQRVAYRAENLEVLRGREAAYRAANKQKEKERKALYYAKNRELIRKREAAYRAGSLELIREREAAYRAANREFVNTRGRENRRKRVKLAKGRVQVIRENARKRGIAFLLSEEEAQIIVSRPCTYCGDGHLCGIDRIDSGSADDKAPYAADNCVPACTVCNVMKMAASQEEFREHVSAIYHHCVAPVDEEEVVESGEE